MKILIAGDFCDNARISPIIEHEDFSSLFNEVREIVSSSDISIVNFEFPIVVNKGKPIDKNGPCLKGQKKSVDALLYAGFSVCTLANNHILDQGEECCLNTKKILEDAGINTVGVGKNKNDSSATLFLKREGQTIAIINCCEHEFSVATDNSAGSNALNPISQYYKIKEARDKADYVLMIIHGGHENYQLPSLRMKETYRFFIDAGADAVVNHHQHCYSGYELYKNKPIFYGLGNFLFDWDNKRNSKWNEGFMLELHIFEDTPFRLIPYFQCNNSASVNLMQSKDVNNFFDEITKLNKIISDDRLLDKHNKEWMDKTSQRHYGIFQPYIDKYTSALFSRGYLPSLLSKRKKLLIQDYINCESHFEKIKYIINK